MSEIPTELQEAIKERYEILRELGRGGMAVVYAARDVKLNREVAIKVLLPDLAMAMGPERFSREIEIAGHLSHPHVLAVYDSGNVGGQLYYVMPLVRGESVRAKLDREKQLPIDVALRISIEVAQALDYAHKQGVVHRDIKPENILLEGEHAIVADFGIARAISTMSEGQALTQTGMALGTASYMSPEQVAAEKDIDGRSDVYSLACVTYEMLAGQPPFTGPNMAAIMARQALEMPPSLTVIRRTIPDEVEETVFQALAKSKVDRFETAGEYADALSDCLLIAPTTTRRTMSSRMTETMKARQRVKTRRKALIVGAIALPVVIAAGLGAKLLLNKGQPAAALAGALDIKKVAVPYFDDATDGRLAYLADGLTETLIDQLSKVPALQVISKDGVARFRGTSGNVDSIAKVLKAGTILKGSVDEEGSNVRIGIRVFDGNSNVEQQRVGFVVPKADELAIRRVVGDSVASVLRRYLGTEVALAELKAGTSDSRAWTLVQRAEKLRKDAQAASAAKDSATASRSFADADSLLAQAAQLDSKWEKPVALRGLIAFNRAQGAKNAVEAAPLVDRGLGFVDEALKMDPAAADAWETRGRLLYLRWTKNIVTDANDARTTLAKADTALSKATEIDRTRASAWSTLSNVRSDADDFTGAKIAANRAYEEDQFQANVEGVIYNLYRTSYNLAQGADAAKWCKEGVTRFPKNRAFARCRLWLRTLAGIPPNVDSAYVDAKEYEELSPPAAQAYVRLEAQLVIAGTLARASVADPSRRTVLADSARKILNAVRAAANEEVDPEHELVGLEAVMRTLFQDPKETDEAIALLRRYVSGNPGHREGLAKSQMWWWTPLKADARYQALVAGR